MQRCNCGAVVASVQSVLHTARSIVQRCNCGAVVAFVKGAWFAYAAFGDWCVLVVYPLL